MHCPAQAVWAAEAGEKVAHKEKLCYAIAVKGGKRCEIRYIIGAIGI